MDTAICTYTGKMFNPFDIDPNTICIEDVAHALSQLCRFNGQCPRFYSVAQHSVELATHFIRVRENPAMAKFALLHDASEAYLGDMPAPFKQHGAWSEYRRLESRVQHAVLEALAPELVDAARRLHAELQRYDRRICIDEADALWQDTEGWWGKATPAWIVDAQYRMRDFRPEWGPYFGETRIPEEAELDFLNLWEQLT